MAMVAFRFEGTPPARGELERRFRETLGRLARAIDSIEHGPASATRSDQVVWVCSQDFIALTYVRKVCCDLGGVRVDPGTQEPRDAELPDWVQTPWPTHGWCTRLEIRFGRVTL